LELTPVLGAPLSRIRYACAKLDAEAVLVIARRVQSSQLRTGVMVAEFVEQLARQPLPRAAAPPPVFEPDNFGDAVRPDFSQARARLRETADVEATP
jgi:hypothetical protein